MTINALSRKQLYEYKNSQFIHQGDSMTPPKTFEEWEKTISHETMYLTGLHRDMARRGWLACEASHADQRERADVLIIQMLRDEISRIELKVQRAERLAEAVEGFKNCLPHHEKAWVNEMWNCLAAYRNKENQP